MPSAGAPTTVAGKAFLPPDGLLHITTVELPAGEILHRVHEARFGSLSFNPGFGRARFSPIKNSAGAFVPTIYAGSSIACALMESVFHDVAYAPGFKPFPRAKLDLQVHSVIQTVEPLKLVDLGTLALRKLGIPRNQLIDTENTEYEITQRWAERFHAQDSSVQGIRWTSRQDDSSSAVVLFGDRIAGTGLTEVAKPRPLTGTAYPDVLNLAKSIGVAIVNAKI